MPKYAGYIQTICLIFVLFFFISNKIPAQEKPKDLASSLDRYIKTLTDSIPDLCALAVVVVDGDRTVYINAFGLADRENGIKADTNTLFYIASTTKSFTSLTAALLDKEGVMLLDKPVTFYTKNINLKNPVPDKVIIQDLLTHTSGLSNRPLGFRSAYNGESGLDDMKGILGRRTTFNDTTYGKYNYTNLGYNIYSVLLESNTGRKWQDELRLKIFDPLKMDHSTAYFSDIKLNGWQAAKPYILTPHIGITQAWLGKYDNNMHAAGGIYSSISDMGRWMRMNLNNGLIDGIQMFPEDLVSGTHLSKTNSITNDGDLFPGDESYGLGWQISNYDGNKVIFHQGGYPGFVSSVSFMPDKNAGVVVLANENSSGSWASNTVVQYVYDWFKGKKNIDSVYDDKLKQFIVNYAAFKKRFDDEYSERLKRTSQLSKPLEEYTGKFFNQDMGEIQINVSDSCLEIINGNMRRISTHYKEPETIRIELIPGSGEVIYFKSDDSGKVTGAVYRNELYEKVN